MAISKFSNYILSLEAKSVKQRKNDNKWWKL